MQNNPSPRITLVINGLYGLPVRFQRELAELSASHFNISLLKTTFQSSADKLAQQALNNGCDLMIACGGDGTLNEVVNGIMAIDEQFRSHLVVAILPLGSGNDFSRLAGRHSTLYSIIDHFQHRATRKIDIGLLRFQSPDHQLIHRYFINISNIGVGGYVSELVNRHEKWLGAALAYHWAIVQGLLSYRKAEITLKTDREEWRGEILNLVLANGRFFAHGLCIAPQAELSDGQVQMLRLGKVNLFDYIRNLGRLKRCKSILHPEAHYQKISKCEVISSETEIPIEMDGEFIGYTPMEMEIRPSAIEFIILNNQLN